MAGNQGKRRDWTRPRLVVDVGPTDPRCFDGHDDVAWTRRRFSQFGLAERFAWDGDLEGSHTCGSLRAVGHHCVAIVATVNQNFSNLFEIAMERTVTIGGPNGSPAVKLKLLHAGAAAAAGVMLAPRATAIAAVAAMIRGVTVTIDAAAPEGA